VNLKSRLARLEQVAAPPQGAYPHLPPLVAFPAEGGEAGARLKARDTRVGGVRCESSAALLPTIDAHGGPFRRRFCSR